MAVPFPGMAIFLGSESGDYCLKDNVGFLKM